MITDFKFKPIKEVGYDILAEPKSRILDCLKGYHSTFKKCNGLVEQLLNDCEKVFVYDAKDDKVIGVVIYRHCLSDTREMTPIMKAYALPLAEYMLDNENLKSTYREKVYSLIEFSIEFFKLQYMENYEFIFNKDISHEIKMEKVFKEKYGLSPIKFSNIDGEKIAYANHQLPRKR